MEQVMQTIENGNLKINNVPVNVDKFGQESFSGNTVYKMSHIFRHMLNNEMTEYDFDDYTLNT